MEKIGETIRMILLGLAPSSKCKKLRFAAMLYDVEKFRVLSVALNNPLEPMAYLCEDECIRFSIPSRTQSMIGACAHAEEICLWNAVREGYNLQNAEMFVFGVDLEGKPIHKPDPRFTCIRCAVQMYHAGIRGVNVWFEDRWHLSSTEKAIKDALVFAERGLEAYNE